MSRDDSWARKNAQFLKDMKGGVSKIPDYKTFKNVSNEVAKCCDGETVKGFQLDKLPKSFTMHWYHKNQILKNDFLEEGSLVEDLSVGKIVLV